MFSNNSSKASEFFESKINYDNEVTSDVKERSIDMWYEVPYFGKIDTNGIPVYPNELLLSNLDQDGRFQALNFVTRAFRTLQSFMDTLKIIFIILFLILFY